MTAKGNGWQQRATATATGNRDATGDMDGRQGRAQGPAKDESKGRQRQAKGDSKGNEDGRQQMETGDSESDRESDA